jgi:hypothetical protein
LYPRADKRATAELYEDDTTTTAYRSGQFRVTPVSVVANDVSKKIHLVIGGASGTFNGASRARSWKLRIHAPVDWPKGFGPVEVKLNGQTVTPDSLGIHRLQRAPEAMPFGDAAGAPDEQVFEMTLPSAPVAQKQTLDVAFQSWE